MNIRAYRYPPSLKDEIERQVNTMLDQGLIQPSKSPFSSPVLLVCKKDGCWRFCVDYKYLNERLLSLSTPYRYLISSLMNWVQHHGSQFLTFTRGIIKLGSKLVKNSKRHFPLMPVTLNSQLFRLALLMLLPRFKAP